MKTWTRPSNKLPKYFHTTDGCIERLAGETYSGRAAPAGMALCPDCEHEMAVMATC